VNYLMTEFFHPECARGVRWDDQMFGIQWPLKKTILSGKDQSYNFFRGVNQ
jgi:dTDP-4-dehydrorhamnose 3,5-epimerase